MDERALRKLLDLQPEEELQLTHHAHLELHGHLLRKLGNKSVRRATKDDIIHVNLNQQKVRARVHEEQDFINTSHFKTFIKQEIFKPIVPSSRRLFQTLKSF